MDTLDLSAYSSQYQLDYGISRIYHIRTANFQHILNCDRSHDSTSFIFGALDVSLY